MTCRIERDIRELAQAIATLEVVVTRIAATGLAPRRRLADELRSMADRAVFERDGLDPVMLDRIVARIELRAARAPGTNTA